MPANPAHAQTGTTKLWRLAAVVRCLIIRMDGFGSRPWSRPQVGPVGAGLLSWSLQRRLLCDRRTCRSPAKTTQHQQQPASH